MQLDQDSFKKIINTRLSTIAFSIFDKAVVLAKSKAHDEVLPEHFLTCAMDDDSSDITAILDQLGQYEDYREEVKEYIENIIHRNSPITFSKKLCQLIFDAQRFADSQGVKEIRSGHIFYFAASDPEKYMTMKPQTAIEFMVVLGIIKKAQGIEGNLYFDKSKLKKDSTLVKYTTDITELAKKKGLDPVLCREQEIRQLIDILVRRKKNNPIIVGDAGVGKTVLVDGLAQRIVNKQVPDELKQAIILSLDLAALQAGAGVKGEFEQRLKNILAEVKMYAVPAILFIDEAHMMLGQNSEIANILKPELSSGKLKVIAATTFKEYKKYFEKESAFSRRFQIVRVDEPSVEDAVKMVRSIARNIEKTHNVIVLDEAVVAAVKLSAKYMANKKLPDKALDLLDTAAARVKTTVSTDPMILEKSTSELLHIDQLLSAMIHDQNCNKEIDKTQLESLNLRKKDLENNIATIREQYEEQKYLVQHIQKLREQALDLANIEDVKIKKELVEKLNQLEKIENKFVYADVNADLVAAIVSDSTGIPVGSMVKNEVHAILSLEDTMKKRIKGQDFALSLITKEIYNAKTYLKPENTPMGVFLLVGPSGVGKTETALALTEALYGRSDFMTTINMSEYKEEHSISRLIGSPPGYVGSGEGGVLTEGVRNHPYSSVLLDEIEKAAYRMMELFFQTFDKGTLSDGDGIPVDFRNTVIMMASNLGSDIIVANKDKSQQEILDLVLPVLMERFSPALIGRMTVIPYLPLSDEHMSEIVDLKLAAMIRRCWDGNKLKLEYDQDLVKFIIGGCNQSGFGARDIDKILRKEVMPVTAEAILRNMAACKTVEKMVLSWDGKVIIR
jgi:type VI secretion system protein VasG